jgi:hypothetical protein
MKNHKTYIDKIREHNKEIQRAVIARKNSKAD